MIFDYQNDVKDLQMYPDKHFDVTIADTRAARRMFDENNPADCVDEFIRITSEDGFVYVLGHAEFLSKVSTLFPIYAQKWLIWSVEDAQEDPGLAFWQDTHYTIVSFWKHNRTRPALLVDQIREPYTESYKKAAGKKRAATAGRFGEGKETVYKAHEKGALPRDVLKIPYGERTVSPYGVSRIPDELRDRLVASCVKEGKEDAKGLLLWY